MTVFSDKETGELLDGYYDNSATFRREWYQQGKLYAFVNAELLTELPKNVTSTVLHKDWLLPWAMYPDIENRKSSYSTEELLRASLLQKAERHERTH